MKKLLTLFTALLFVGSMWADEAEFAPSNFSGQGTSGTGSAISATVSGVTFACDKGYGTTQIRCYSGGKITISSSNVITAISFTFSGSYTGGLETSYTNLSTKSWEKSLTSQARITACTVTYSAGGTDPVAVTGVTLDESSIELEIGETQTLVATIIPANATTQTVTWESDDEDIATVDEDGLVTAVAEGIATITATTTDGDFTASCDVEVIPVLPKSSLVFTAKCNGSGTANDGAVWTVTSDGTESTFDNARGIHYGTNSASVEYINLSTSNIDGTIKKVVVNASAGSSATVSVTVGGNAFGGDAKDLTSSAAEYVFRGSASGEIVVLITKPSSATKALYCKSIVVSYEEAAIAQPAFSPATTSFIGSVEVTMTSTTEGAAIYYTTDEAKKDAPSTSTWTLYDSENKPSFSATTTLYAAAKKNDDWSAVASKTYTRIPVDHAGTAADPYTIADARTAINAGYGTTDVYVAGIISQVDSYDSDHNSITYWISEDGTTTNQFKVYSGKGLNGADFEAVTDLVLGDEVVVFGNIKNYQGVDEFDYDNQLYSIDHPIVPSIYCETSIEVPAAGESDVIAITYNNIDVIDAQIAFYEADGTTPATYDWLEASIDGDNNVAYTVEANASTDARSAYLKVYVGTVYSPLVTIEQAGYVPDYATLPFAFNGGKAAIENTYGLTQDGLGSDYSSAPKLKFDSSDDYVILKINEAPGTLTFDIKGNSFSGGTFKVQTSIDGETYTDLESYTALGDTQSEEFDDLASNVRYIKWIYTNKSSGNVALGNINLAKPAATAIDNTEVEGKAVKVLRNGILLIEKNGHTYNAQGQLVK